jgi:hypothetical protein
VKNVATSVQQCLPKKMNRQTILREIDVTIEHQVAVVVRMSFILVDSLHLQWCKNEIK